VFPQVPHLHSFSSFFTLLLPQLGHLFFLAISTSTSTYCTSARELKFSTRHSIYGPPELLHLIDELRHELRYLDDRLPVLLFRRHRVFTIVWGASPLKTYHIMKIMHGMVHHRLKLISRARTKSIKMDDITIWLAIFLIIVLMMVKWRLGLYGILDKAIDWIRRKRNH